MSRHFSYREPRYPRGHNYRPRKRLRVGRLIIVILIFAAIIAGIIFGVLFLTKQGPFASGASTPEPSAAPSAEETAAAAPSSTPTPSAAPTIDPGNPSLSIRISDRNRAGRRGRRRIYARAAYQFPRCKRLHGHEGNYDLPQQ